MIKHSQGLNYSPLLKGQQHSVLEHQLAPERGAPNEQQASFLLTQMCAFRTPDPTSHIRKLKKPDFKQTATATYQKPLEVRTATQRQQQRLISYIRDRRLPSVNLDACWGSRAHATSMVLKCSARMFSLRAYRQKSRCEHFCPITASFAFPAPDVFVFSTVFPK